MEQQQLVTFENLEPLRIFFASYIWQTVAALRLAITTEVDSINILYSLDYVDYASAC